MMQCAGNKQGIRQALNAIAPSGIANESGHNKSANKKFASF